MKKKSKSKIYYNAIWQPIETAPKDGTVILVINGKEEGNDTN